MIDLMVVFGVSQFVSDGISHVEPLDNLSSVQGRPTI